MNEFETWKAGGYDYDEGMKLYNTYAPRYRPNKALSAQINGHRNSFSRETMIEELAAIAAALIKAHTPKISHKYHVRGAIDGLPPDLAKMDANIPLQYKRRDFLRYKARDTVAGPTLRDMAAEIVALDMAIRKAYMVLDFWKRTGTYPPDYYSGESGKEDKIEQLTDWLRAMKSYPSYISRNKGNPEKAEEVKAKQKVLEEINTYLNYVDQKE